MELSTLLFGSIADVIQDNRIKDAEAAARVASSSANHGQLNTARLAQTIEQRIREVEYENSVMSMLIVGLLKHLSKTQPEEAQKIIDQVSLALRSGSFGAADILQEMVDVPKKTHTPIADYKKPTPVRPMSPQRPVPTRASKKPQK